jgi:hypothetical protein
MANKNYNTSKVGVKPKKNNLQIKKPLPRIPKEPAVLGGEFKMDMLRAWGRMPTKKMDKHERDIAWEIERRKFLQKQYESESKKKNKKKKKPSPHRPEPDFRITR